MSVSNADDIAVMPLSLNKELHINYSTPTRKDPLEGKTTAVIALMRGKSKDGYCRHRSSKHYKQELVQSC